MASTPFKNLKAQLDSDYPLGTLVMFDHEDEPLYGIVTGLKKDRYQVLVPGGASVELTKVRLHRVPGYNDKEHTSVQDKLDFLGALSEKKATSEQLESVWKDIISAKQGPVSCFEKPFHPAEITKNIFASVSPINYIATRKALILDKVFFQRDETGFIPRKQEQVELLKEEEKKRAKRFESYKELQRFLREKYKDKSIAVPQKLEFLIEQIKDLAASTTFSNEEDFLQAEELLHFIEGGHPENTVDGKIWERAFHILYKAGILKKDTNLSLIRHKPKINFNETLEKAALNLLETWDYKNLSDITRRQDFTNLESFTIDDSSTKDMDDALSLQETATGYRLYVHISDVASIISKDSALDQEAMLRATSIYCPDITIQMFPEAICHNLSSLVANQIRPAITIIFDVDKSFAITSATVEPSIISVSRKYSYEEVDQFINDTVEPFITLKNIASTHEQKRHDDGAVPVIKRDAQPVVLANNEIIIVEVDENSPARALVGEMMVLANIVIANFLNSNNIPALYRSQEKPEPQTTDFALIPEGPARSYAERGKLKKSSVGTTPGYHATLGTNAYVQSTSPIRRYLDLVLQRQILAFFNRLPLPYSESDLRNLSFSIEESLQKAAAVSKESKRFWLLRYLEKYYAEARSIFATVIRTDTKFPIVELDELFINVPARIHKPQIGKRYELRLERVDPRGDFVRFEERRN